MRLTVVYDWNGTLLDDAGAFTTSINAVLTHFKLAEIDVDTLRAVCEFPFSRLYEKLGLPSAAQENDNELFFGSYQPLAAASRLRVGAERALEAFKDAADVLILSNHIESLIREHIALLGVESKIAHILAYASRESQYQGFTKGEMLDRYMREQNISPQRTVIVGDTPEEVGIARSLGLTSVAMTGGMASETRLRDAGADHVVRDHNELLTVLKRENLL
ncbi:HAD family hydrolase [Mycobacterium sp. CBMA271]|uniref:HAD family hydrolase n=1 Tax=unclassified Mycobacteroides TaxID=2618759 RepID=UPI0012DBCFAC|nr:MULTISPECIES: HAD hydrolase-like protein [unclassified Mycobacteroides]MUM18041.1 phosphatase [Mycobacteroides sp. CBMA 326]MUM23479.1 HAD family hydrolase [Mycobacteroides sp. CBMA 271]